MGADQKKPARWVVFVLVVCAGITGLAVIGLIVGPPRPAGPTREAAEAKAAQAREAHRAQVEQKWATLDPKQFESAVAKIESLISKKNWSAADAQMDVLWGKLAPFVFLDVQPRQPAATQFMSRVRAARNQIIDERTRAEREVRRAQEERRIAALLTAEKIFAAYTANEIAADQFFKGKSVEFTGRVESVGKDILGTPYLGLDVGADQFGVVQALFSRADETRLASINKGERVTLRCTGKGKMLIHVLLDQCSVS